MASVLLLLLAATACGTNLDETELLAANGSLTEMAAGVQNGTAGPGRAGKAETSSGRAAEAAPGRRSGGGGGTSGAAAGGPTNPGSTVGGEAGPAAGGAPGSGGEILLGSFGTGSGPIGAQLASIPVAVRAWVADVNARGGLGGRPVRMLIEDDGGDPARALAIARRMVEEQGVMAFFGTFGATTIQAVVPFLEDVQVPVIGSEGGNPIEDHSPMIFNPQLSADRGVGTSILAALVKQSDARKAALLYCGESETCRNSRTTIRDYAPVVGVDVVYEAQVSLAQPDYTAEMIAARNAGADVVLAFIDVASIARIIRSAKRQGWTPEFGGGVAFNEDVVKQFRDDAQGLLAPAATAPYMTSPRMADYRDAVARHVPGGVLGGTGASAWVQGKLMERIFEEIEGEPSTEAILAAVHSLRDETLGWRVPPITFNRGPHAEVNQCSVPLRFEGERFVPSAGEKFVCARPDGLEEIVPPPA